MYELPATTLHNLAELVTSAIQWAVQRLRAVFSALGPLLAPPHGLEVRSSDGGEFTGLLLLEANQVAGGMVARVGHAPRYDRGTLAHPWSRSRKRDEDEDTMLKHWAIDTRDDEDDSWRR